MYSYDLAEPDLSLYWAEKANVVSFIILYNFLQLDSIMSLALLVATVALFTFLNLLRVVLHHPLVSLIQKPSSFGQVRV